MNLNSFPDSRAFPDSISAFLKAASPELRVWHYILDAFGDDIWKFPVFTYVCRNAKFSDDGEIRMTKKAKHNCVYLMQNVARYLYAKGFAHHEVVGIIQEEIILITTLINRGVMYEPTFKITSTFKRYLNQPIPIHLQKGLCALVEFATQWREIPTFTALEARLKRPVLETSVVTHILSKNWRYTPIPKISKKIEWTPERIECAMNRIGNLVLVEKNIHTDRPNHYYSPHYKMPAINKKYRFSIFAEVKTWRDFLVEKNEISGWGYDAFQYRQKKITEWLNTFFEVGRHIYQF